MASEVSHEDSGGFSEEVAKCIKESQRGSFRRICEESGDISGPTIPNVANVLNYLFKDNSFKPSTIAAWMFIV